MCARARERRLSDPWSWPNFTIRGLLGAKTPPGANSRPRPVLLPLHRLPRGFHARRDVLGVPTGEAGEVLRLLAEARRQRGAVGVGGRAVRGAAPGVTQHV